VEYLPILDLQCELFCSLLVTYSAQCQQAILSGVVLIRDSLHFRTAGPPRLFTTTFVAGG
jgi:hypothetical protein